MSDNDRWFIDARYGLFIHYGLYSMLGRGEWVLNREHLDIADYKRLADSFRAENLDFDKLLGRARNNWGMNYAVLTCKHHEGFCLYDSKLTGFTSVKTACGRDLVGEFVDACRKHGLRIGLYHTLNDWTASPNAVDALENPEQCHQRFIDFVHGQIREIMTNYGKIDLMWYDGWWPFDADGWQAEKLNAMVRKLQPGILVNGRCGLKGDFDTPEGHISASEEGRAWEACTSLNDNWGYHKGDHNWKSAKAVAEMLRQCAAGVGNLLLNVGPKGDGSLPQESIERLDAVGVWLKRNGESIFNTKRFVLDAHRSDVGGADWTPAGRFTATDSAFYWHIRHWPGSTLRLSGVKCKVTDVTLLANGKDYPFEQQGDQLVVKNAGEEMDTTSEPLVFRFRTDGEPRLYLCGGYNQPSVEHCRYDPLPSDIAFTP